MKLKKIISLLVGTLCFASLCSCDKKAEENSETKTLYKLLLTCLKDSQGRNIQITPKNSGTAGDKIINAKVVTAINFENSSEQIGPRIYFVNNDLENLINVSNFERDLNNNQVQSVALNNGFIDGEILQGEIMH